MPSSSRSWDFVTTVEGWASSGPGICVWDGSDGDPAPGCLKSSALGSGGGFPSQPFVGGPNWSDWGVSAGFVTSVDVSMFVKYGGGISFPEGDGVAAQVQTTSGTYTLFTTPDVRTLTNWTAFSGTVILSGTDGPSDFATLRLLPVPNNSQVANTLIDHVQMTINFSGPTGASSRSIIGTQVRAIASSTTVIPPANPLHMRTSVGGLARAKGALPCEAQFLLRFAGILSGDFTKTAYGQPTVITLVNPQSGQEMFVDIPAGQIVDLAGFLSGYMGDVQLERIGGEDNCNSISIVFRGLTIVYKKKRSSGVKKTTGGGGITPIMPPSPATLEDFGPLVFSALQEKQWLYHHPSDGHAHLLMFWDLLGSGVFNVPFQTLDLDLVAGTHTFTTGLLGRPGPFGGAAHSNGKVYLASNDPGYFQELDPITGTTRQIHALADKDGQYCEIGDDGLVYIGEAIHGYVESYDPATDTWTNYGIMDDPGPPYFRYAYTLGADTRYIYVGMGQSPWYLVIYDRVTNTQTSYFKTSGLPASFVYKGTSGGWYYQAGTAWYQLIGGVPVLLGSPPSVVAWYHHANIDFSDGNTMIPAVATAYGYEFDFSDATPFSGSVGTSPAIVRWRLIGAGSWNEVTVDPTVAKALMKQLTAKDTATLFGIADAYGPALTWDIAGNTASILGVEHASNYDVEWNPVNSRWYISGYADYTGKYDPGAVWNPPTNPKTLATISKYHYYQAVAADGTVFVGVHHERDSVGGELGWYDPTTDAEASLRTPFLLDDVSHIISAVNGTKIVYASNAVSPNVNGRLFVVDAATKTIERTITPVVGLGSAGKLVEVASGVVIGVSGNKAYKVNITTGTVIWSVTLSATTYPNTRSTDQRPRLGPDGKVWVCLASSIGTIDSTTGMLVSIYAVTTPVNILFVRQSSGTLYDLYIYGDSTLRRLTGISF